MPGYTVIIWNLSKIGGFSIAIDNKDDWNFVFCTLHTLVYRKGEVPLKVPTRAPPTDPLGVVVGCKSSHRYFLTADSPTPTDL
jgi:hypothetical protein